MLILVIYDEKTAITDRFNDIRHITNVFSRLGTEGGLWAVRF